MLEKVDLTLQMPKKEYKKRLDEAGARLTDMLLKTSTLIAPWTVVEAIDKYYARIKFLRTLVDTLSRELNIKLPAEKAHPKK